MSLKYNMLTTQNSINYTNKREKLGEGTFGIVYSCTSPNTGKSLAFKRNLAEKEISFISAVRETDILVKLRGHPYIVFLDKVAFKEDIINNCCSPLITSRDRLTQRDDNIHFYFDKENYDMYTFIYGGPTPYGYQQMYNCNFVLAKRYMIQTLLALEYIHGSGIIHRDIKPNNILINFRDHTAKICDFGLAKPYTSQGNQTPKVVTTWYRAPEIALHCPNYTNVVDIWSLGCVFLELVSKRPFINIPNNSDDDDTVISLILAALPQELPTQIVRKIVTSSRWRTVKLKTHRNVRKSFAQKIAFSPYAISDFQRSPGSFDSFCDLLNNMIKFDWTERFSATQCLNHEFFTNYKKEIMECREKFKPTPIDDYIIEAKFNNERKWMANICIFIFNIKTIIPGYTHRGLFQTIDIFDRHMSYLMKIIKVEDYALESEDVGLYYSRKEVELRVYVCFYICIKYYSTVHCPVTFQSILPENLNIPKHLDTPENLHFSKHLNTPENLNIAEQFEGSLLQHNLQFNIYRPTIYEIADKFGDFLTEEDIRDLVILFTTNNSITGLTPTQLYEYYRKNMRGKGRPLTDLQLPINRPI
jgi:serine/threonine protein kinase